MLEFSTYIAAWVLGAFVGYAFGSRDSRPKEGGS